VKKCILSIILLLLLCGCQKFKPEYLVSSIGFDKVEDKYTVLFETVIINTENTSQSLKVLKGEGESIEQAVAQIKRQSTQPLLLSHSGVIAVSENITRDDLKQICEYALEQEITLSAYFVKTQNCEKLLKQKPVSSVCVGYDIMGLIKQNKPYRNRFFEIINADFNAVIPKISLKEGGLYFENGK
jgi:hypothetical protein